jgi:hypothetical protein
MSCRRRLSLMSACQICPLCPLLRCLALCRTAGPFVRGPRTRILLPHPHVPPHATHDLHPPDVIVSGPLPRSRANHTTLGLRSLLTSPPIVPVPYSLSSSFHSLESFCPLISQHVRSIVSFRCCRHATRILQSAYMYESLTVDPFEFFRLSFFRHALQLRYQLEAPHAFS